MTAAVISVQFPPMAIDAVDGSHKRTAQEPGVATINLPGRTIVLPCLIPPTPVTRGGGWLLRQTWLVAACVGTGHTADGSLAVQLPPELTAWSWADMSMVAEPIDCPTTLLLADGSEWTGMLHCPPCRVSGILSAVQTAEQITAQGTLVLQ